MSIATISKLNNDYDLTKQTVISLKSAHFKRYLHAQQYVGKGVKASKQI